MRWEEVKSLYEA